MLSPSGLIKTGSVRSVATFGEGLAAVTVGRTTALYDLGTGARVRDFTTGTANVGVTSADGRHRRQTPRLEPGPPRLSRRMEPDSAGLRPSRVGVQSLMWAYR
ncbi:hypothetical protein SAMN05444920_112215 [Nonomuraea solani]|uniref:Uncharacterized protein n=1 Tax=Nonomuraea solani TaxID=1144553 RepID=A0A1H6EMP3_9ACTN|nr:hypothetical protein [Nonomuraea solani]SEG99092.1 hypothetical protein SAMN05444920_112215 [Nonomuraea solani]